jgi:hypothetical protein
LRLGLLQGKRMYNALKTNLAEWIGLSKDALHIHVGLGIFLLIALLARKPLWSTIPLLGLLAFEIVNELADLFHVHEGASFLDWAGSAKDLINTMIWPTVVYLVSLWQRTRSRRSLSEIPVSFPDRSR